MKTLTASDRLALIKLASNLPRGDDTRKAILAGLLYKAHIDSKPSSAEAYWTL